MTDLEAYSAMLTRAGINHEQWQMNVNEGETFRGSFTVVSVTNDGATGHEEVSGYHFHSSQHCFCLHAFEGLAPGSLVHIRVAGIKDAFVKPVSKG